MKQSRPKLEYRNRDQMDLGMVDLNNLIDEWHPARAVWALLEGMDFSRWEEQIRSREGEAGRSAVPPRLLAALWIYGYSLGVGSARALERMQSHEPGLRWLCADEPVNHHTLSDFRVRYEEALDGLFSQVLAGLEQGGWWIWDGGGGRDEGACGERGGEPASAGDAGGEFEAGGGGDGGAEAGDGGFWRGGAAAGGGRACGAGAGGADAAESAGARAAAGGEPGAAGAGECERAGGAEDVDADGLYAPAWNLQLATETADNVVVGVEVTSQGSDAEQLPGMAEQIRRRLGRVSERMLADGGYTSRSNVEYAHREGIELYAPWEPDAARHRGGWCATGLRKSSGRRPSCMTLRTMC